MPETTCCIACAVAFKDDDGYYPEVDGGFIHATCCGPERECYVGGDGEPLGLDDPIPAPSRWLSEDSFRRQRAAGRL